MRKSKFMAILLTLVLTLSMANGLVFNVSAASPKLNKKKVTITVGKTVKLKVKKNKAKKKVKWKSANKKIVKVTKKGKIKGIKPGKTVVTAKVGKKKLKCKVKVVAKKQTTKPTVKPTVPATTKAPVQTTQAPVTTKAPVQTTQAPVTTKAPVQTTQTPVTTKAPVQTTQAPTTAKTTTIVDDGKPGPKEAFGEVIIGIDGLSVQFVWGNDNEIISSGQTFNIYYDGVLGEQGVNPAVITHVFATGGKHVITIKGYLNGKESQGVNIGVDLGGSGDNQTTTNSSEPTQPSTTQPTTTKPATTKPATTTKPSSENPTTALTFTTDSSIEKPFGLNVSQASEGYVNIVWGRGTIDCYNVYVDGVRRRTGVSAQLLKLPVYTEGTHTIAITTVVGTKESEKLEAQVAITGIGEKETEPETCPPELQPQLKENVPMKDDRIAIELNNKTNGKYSDDQIYWCILGNNSDNKLCYMDKYGNMIPASESLNTIDVNGKKYANIYHTLAESDHVYAPTVRSGRMYLSYGKPVYVTFNTDANGNAGYAGPDLNNPSDVNANTLFEFAEFTIEGKSYWGNTTRVDYFCFPMITRLVGNALYGTYDKTVGDIGTRDQIFNAWKNSAPAAWKSLYDGKRIMAPCKTTFNEGKENGHYFDNYINEFWNKYSNETLVFRCDAGTFRGRVSGDHMTFTKDGDGGTYTIYKPTTQDVLEGKGNFNRGNSTELVIEAQLCAAFNRGVATDPANYQNPSAYYKNGTYNYYSKFLHEHSVNNFSYGFCYDDVNDQSTLLHYTNPTALILDLKW